MTLADLSPREMYWTVLGGAQDFQKGWNTRFGEQEETSKAGETELQAKSHPEPV